MNFFVRLVGNNLMIFIPSTRNWSKNWVVHLYFFPCKSMDPTAEIIIFTYFFIVVMADFFFISLSTQHTEKISILQFFFFASFILCPFLTYQWSHRLSHAHTHPNIVWYIVRLTVLPCYCCLYLHFFSFLRNSKKKKRKKFLSSSFVAVISS